MGGGLWFSFWFDLSLADCVVMNGVAAFADHGADVLIFNVSFAVGFGFPHCAALGKDFKAVAITIIINDLVYILSFTFISHDGISFR